MAVRILFLSLEKLELEMIGKLRVEGGQIILDGYPDGSTVHGIEGIAADELRRLAIFKFELRLVQRLLTKISQSASGTTQEDSDLTIGLSDAALLAFCRCFDFDHPLKPLKSKRIFSPQQRDAFDRLKNIRNWKVGHDKQLTNGTYSLLVLDKKGAAIEAVSLSLQVPFSGMQELEELRTLSQIAMAWVEQEYERVAAQIVRTHNASPALERPAHAGFSINILGPQDFFCAEGEKTVIESN